MPTDRNRHRTPVGIGVVGNDQICPGPLRLGQREIDGARFLRVGKRHGGKGGVRFGLVGYDARCRESAGGNRSGHDGSANSVQRGVDPTQIAVGVARHQRRNPPEIGRNELAADDGVIGGAGHVVEVMSSDLRDPRGDLCLGGWHDLRPVSQRGSSDWDQGQVAPAGRPCRTGADR